MATTAQDKTLHGSQEAWITCCVGAPFSYKATHAHGQNNNLLILHPYRHERIQSLRISEHFLVVCQSYDRDHNPHLRHNL